MDNQIYCKGCCREIDEETSKKYNGLCKNCYKERFVNSDETESSYFNGYHKLAISLFILSIISSIIVGFKIPTDSYDDFNVVAMLVVMFSGFLIFMLFYMLATIIEELRNLQNK